MFLISWFWDLGFEVLLNVVELLSGFLGYRKFWVFFLFFFFPPNGSEIGFFRAVDKR